MNDSVGDFLALFMALFLMPSILIPLTYSVTVALSNLHEFVENNVENNKDKAGHHEVVEKNKEKAGRHKVVKNKKEEADRILYSFHKPSDILTTELALNGMYFLFYFVDFRSWVRSSFVVAFIYLIIKFIIHAFGKNIWGKEFLQALRPRSILFIALSLFIIFVPVVYQQVFKDAICQEQKRDAIVSMIIVQSATFVLWVVLAVVTRPFGRLKKLKNQVSNGQPVISK